MDPADAQFYTCVGLILAAIVTCAIWTETFRYYGYFHQTDPTSIVRLGVALGSAVAT